LLYYIAMLRQSTNKLFYYLTHSVSTFYKSTVKTKYYFREFVDTLVVALRGMEQSENPVAIIHPVLVHEGMKPVAEVDAHDSR